MIVDYKGTAAFCDSAVYYREIVYHKEIYLLSNTMKEVPIWEKLNLTVKEAAEYSNIGINKIDNMLNNPMCTFVLHVGKKRLVKRKEFEKYLEKSIEI